ncbi:MAG: hypothetical protein IIB62_04885 [Proteobacteria bacterium]|nr:hypothetical protein [Pseudomonadota bacterium]MCH8917063.1 hypothetical protein [Pseudomonadota bacterium]
MSTQVFSAKSPKYPGITGILGVMNTPPHQIINNIAGKTPLDYSFTADC